MWSWGTHTVKLVFFAERHGLYDLESDPDERTNLLHRPLSGQAAVAYDEMLGFIRASPRYSELYRRHLDRVRPRDGA